MDIKDYAALMQMGGLLAFSWIVWQELRTQRQERNALDERMFRQLSAMAESIASMVAGLMADRLGTRINRVRKGLDDND